jgi:hypothetical protein
MSYYNSNFYQNPQPYDSSDIGEPVPGWGLSARSYAQPRVGVGATLSKAVSAKTTAAKVLSAPKSAVVYADAPPFTISSVPWYYWIGGSAVLVGFGSFAYYKGWFG